MKQRWKLTIEYDGTGFAGWQIQKDILTVQQCLENAVFAFSGETVRCHAAGRTDAGVHALGQVAHIDLEKDYTPKNVRDAINFHMRPHPAVVVLAEPMDMEFHARFGACKRTYCYKIIMGRPPEPVLFHGRAWHIKRSLNLTAMREAANYLLGTHDFSSFRAADCQAKSPLRSLDRLDIIEKKDSLGAGQHIEIWAEAKSFLHHQIRNIVGTLELVGNGRWQPIDVKTALEAKDRTKGGPMAPAGGLYFVRVDYI